MPISMQHDPQITDSKKMVPTRMSTKQALSNKIQNFFAKRAPRSDNIQLTLRNVYIFFNRSGLLFGLLLVITFITGVNYGNNLILGLCFYLASIWVISLHLTFSHIYGLNIRLLNTPLVQVGEIGWVSLELLNNKGQPSRQLNLEFDHSLHNLTSNSAKHNGKQNAKQNAITSIWQQQNIAPNLHLNSLQGRLQIQLPVVTHQRGRLELPRLVASTVYPLGLMRAWSYIYFVKPVWVYPKPMAFDLQAQQVLSSAKEQEFSEYKATGQNDFESLDEYVAGESLARVSWAHLARGQGMLTKQFADTVGREQQLNYSNMLAPLHEEKLSQLTYAVLKLGEAGSAFQLNLPNDEGAIGQGASFVEACLMRLAKCP